MGLWPVFMSVHSVCVCWLWKSEKGVGSPGTGVTNGCEQPCGCWKLSPGSLEKQTVLLTTGHLSSPVATFLMMPSLQWSELETTQRLEKQNKTQTNKTHNYWSKVLPWGCLWFYSFCDEISNSYDNGATKTHLFPSPQVTRRCREMSYHRTFHPLTSI